MRYVNAVLVLAFIIASVGSVQGSSKSFTINLDNPPSGPDITGRGWQNPCQASGNECPLYCGRFGSSGWMPGYYFDSPFAGDGTCTLTLKATSYSVTEGHGPDQTNEVVEAQVNGVVFDRTEDICTGLGASCACNVATKVSTRIVPLTRTNNHITVRMPGDSIAVKGAILTCTGQRTCSKGWNDSYKCQGSWVLRMYTEADCDVVWNQYEYCDYGCDDGECIPGCDPGYLNETQCNGNWLQKKYQNYDCSTEWRNYQYCEYGCSGGACEPGPDPYCTDSDGGIVWTVQGNTYGMDSSFQAFSKSDYCSGNILFEYYCNGLNWAVVQHECDGTCINGRCGPDNGCTDECPYWGKRECVDGGTRVCGFYDADSCLDWDYQSCDGDCCDDDCDDGSCDDECEDVGWENDYRCSGNWRQRLYTYDDDGDCEEEWRNYEYCSNGCANDDCVDNPVCPTCPYCGDRSCNNGETCSTCPSDCGQCNYCGDRVCNSGETCYTCPTDCGQCSYCGDRSCNNGESCSTCPTDCGSCNTCGNGICNMGETCSTCPTDCGRCDYCGNGVCGSGETCTNCQQDCGSCGACGNGVCSAGETCSTCPADCGSCVTCGDGTCSSSESCSTCPSDCGPCLRCGDGLCTDNENCASCATDCGICDLCGDGVCTGTESCLNCISDCGECVTPCGIEIGENVEVTAEACIEFRGSGNDQFRLTIYNREDHSAVYQIDLSGDAARWARVESPSVRVPEYGTGVFVIDVTVPEDTEQGLYNLSVGIKSGGELVLTKQLYVSVAEPVEPGEAPVVVISDEPSPTGAFLIGEVDIIWVIIGLAVVINIILAVVLISRRTKKA